MVFVHGVAVNGDLWTSSSRQGRFELVSDSRTFIPEDNPSALVRLIEEG